VSLSLFSDEISQRWRAVHISPEDAQGQGHQVKVGQLYSRPHPCTQSPCSTISSSSKGSGAPAERWKEGAGHALPVHHKRWPEIILELALDLRWRLPLLPPPPLPTSAAADQHHHHHLASDCQACSGPTDQPTHARDKGHHTMRPIRLKKEKHTRGPMMA
jgi:hypothetical protein